MFIKRDKKEDCLIAGYVVGDQKQKEYNGKSYVEFGIGMGKDENGENLPIVNIAIWERTIPDIQKGDRVLAAGKLKQTEKDNKKYYSMNADFVIKEQMKIAVETQETPVTFEIDDNDLPF